jgi:hypothetical protein
MPAAAVPRHPWWDTSLDAPAPERLAAIPSSDGNELTHLFGDVPRAVFAATLAPDGPARPEEGSWWLLHLSGYHGGQWLRSAIARAQPDAPLVQLDLPPTEDGFRAQVAAAEDALAATRHDPLAHLDRRLLTVEPPGLVDTFGYNEGYLQEIVDRPPEGLHPSAGYEVVALENVPPELRDPVENVRAAAHRRGREVWSTGLSVQGFDAAEYAALLDVSDTFLRLTRDVTAVGLFAAAARDAPTAERVGLADAQLTFWLASYITGLTDGS